jgi:hypothetical protein
MSVSLPNGSAIFLASAYASSDTTATAVSNSSAGQNAVVSDTTPFAQGDIIEVSSGWARLNGRVVRVGTVVAGTSYQLEGIDTNDTTQYPSGGGVPFSARKVSTWTEIQQITNTSSTGGEQQFTEYAFLADGAQRRIPTTKSAIGYTLTIADDPTLAHFAVLQAADADRKVRAIKIQLANGGYIYMNGYVTMAPSPTLSVNEIMTLEVTLSLAAPVTRYTS